MDERCLFCELPEKNPERLFFENSSFYAIKDLAPVSPGHSLIIVKEHIVSLFDLNPKKMYALWGALQEVKTLLDLEYSPSAYNIGINEGRAAGRTQDHLHIHLIPRYLGDVDDPRGGVRNLMEKIVEPY